MSQCRTAYQGDEALGRLLKKAGSAYGVPALAALVAGLNGAPEPIDGDGWIELVAPAASDALRAQLRAFRTMQVTQPASALAVDRAARVGALRAELQRRGLGGFVIPRADEHQGEYVPARAERLAWLTGFTGSAGLAILLQQSGAVFVDGRYTLQVAQQVDAALFVARHVTDQPPETWIAEMLPKGGKLGYDPWLHTPDGLEPLRRAAARAGGDLVACAGNPLDAVWSDQPPPPLAPVRPHELRFAGHESRDKRMDLGAKLAEGRVDAAVLTAPDSIAWLLNIRGGDVPRTPLPLGFAILNQDGNVDLFMDRRKFVPGLETHLGNAVSVYPPEELGGVLDRLGGEKRRVLADPGSASAWLFDRLAAAGAEVVRGADPCALPKACKNAVEIEGMRAAHRRDGAAVTRFLAWLAGAAPSGRLTEIEAAEQLAQFRRANELFRDFSFDTISGAGPNGAIVHYRALPTTNRQIRAGELYLVDSGAQYLDGTTDITRTVAIGTPSSEMRDRFTRVLKGHIALGSARFPRGTSGSQLDVLARTALWQAGLDYDHGTGHGVGSYLGVHEGPQRISKIPNRVALEVGMVVSNEPGFYKTGGFGIRIENLVTVVAAPVEGAERPMLGFENLTLAPIDRTLVEPSLLTPQELQWLDDYHARVRAVIGPLVEGDTAAWLADATRPIGT